jgi:hypothetical protein
MLLSSTADVALESGKFERRGTSGVFRLIRPHSFGFPCKISTASPQGR